MDGAGNVYIADYYDSRIRKVTAATGLLSTVAGTGTNCASPTSACGDGGPATAAGADLFLPFGVAVDGAGNIYIADTVDNRVRKVTASTGILSTVAGSGTVCASSTSTCGDGGSATASAAELNGPYGVAVDGAGDLYIADTSDSRVRKVTAATGILTTVAGSGTRCSSPTATCGDGGSATASGADFNEEPAVNVDSSGNLYVADPGNNRIRIVSTKAGIDFPTATTAGTTDTTDGTSTATLNNIGNLPLTIASMQNSSSNFVLGNPNTGGCSTSMPVAAGGSCLLGEEFTPVAGSTGLVVGNLAITDNSLNAASALQNVPLVGGTTADVLSVTISGKSVAAGAGSTTITVTVGYSGTAADTGAITVKVNGSASGVGTPTCITKPSHMNCEYRYTGTALATKGNYPLAVSVGADSNYTNGSSTGTLVVTGGSLRPLPRPIIPEREAR